jgi:DNA mismatch repair ATPase MutS
MGGKSTMLRTVCTLAIMAQIGSYVPAEYYNCEIIDRIFTRIGASDKL